MVSVLMEFHPDLSTPSLYLFNILFDMNVILIMKFACKEEHFHD